MTPESPGAGQFTRYTGGGADQIVTMSPRRNVPLPSAYNVYSEELPPAERERLRKLELPRVAAHQDLPRFQCKYYATCKYAFATEGAKLEHESRCLDEQKIAAQFLPKQEPAASGGVSREEVVAIVKDAIGELVKAIKGEAKPKGKKRGRPRGSSKAHRGEAQAVRPESAPEVEHGQEPLADPPAEPGEAASAS